MLNVNLVNMVVVNVNSFSITVLHVLQDLYFIIILVSKIVVMDIIQFILQM